MDATRIRALIIAAKAAQAEFDAAIKAADDAQKAIEPALEKMRKEVGNLKAALADQQSVIFGDELVGVMVDPNRGAGYRLYARPLVTVPVVAPPTQPPLPEAVAAPKAETPAAKETAPKPETTAPKTVPPVPTSGGKIPDTKKK